MRKVRKYHGVVVPMVTPINEKGRLDSESVIKLLDYLIQNRTFPFILGTTGESASLPWSLRKEFVRICAEYINHKTTLYAGISDNCFENTVRAASEYYDLGVDVFVAHTPYYYPISKDNILNFFENLGDSIPGPLILYNIPSTTHISLPIDVIEKLSHHPNIVGLKDSERSQERVEIFAEMFQDRDDFSLLSGWTFQSAFVLKKGFDGIVPSTANYIPGLFRELFEISISDPDKSEVAQEKVNPYAILHQKDRMLSEVIAALKVMMTRKNLCLPWVLPPLYQLAAEEETRILEELEKLETTGVTA